MSGSENTKESAPKGASLARLVEVMDRLLAPDGCPWDREQTLESLEPYLIEETFEVVEALHRGHPADHCEELGDLLMNIVFHAALRQRQGAFTIDDVVQAIVDKLIRRHPHVFADASAKTSGEVLTQWSEIKEWERRAKAEARGQDPDALPPRRTLEGVPAGLPALSRAQALSARAAKIGFDWPDTAGSRTKVREELGEIEEAESRGDRAALEHEVGDLLFAVVNLARKLDVDAERALRAASHRFSDRFEYIEDRLRERGSSPEESTLDDMDALWNQAKRR